MKLPHRFLLAAALIPLCVQAAETGFTIEQSPRKLDIRVGGKPFASYVLDDANKPYLWPVYGPTGKAVTRDYPMQDNAREDKAQRDHPHHRGITFGHESIGGGAWRFPEKWDAITGEERHTEGADTWHEKRTFEEFLQQPKNALRGKQRLPMLGTIQHRSFTTTHADASHAVVIEELDYLAASGQPYLAERRTLTFRVLADSRAIDIDQVFTASNFDVRFDDRKDAGLSIRVPSSMAVDSKKGGRIINSEGLADKDAWGKPARWCDYNGPVDDETLGIAFLNHPSSLRFPTRWHVRTYGLFSANPFLQHDADTNLPEAPVLLKKGQQTALHHRLLLHVGNEKSADIEAQWKAYADAPTQ